MVRCSSLLWLAVISLGHLIAGSHCTHSLAVWYIPCPTAAAATTERESSSLFNLRRNHPSSSQTQHRIIVFRGLTGTQRHRPSHTLSTRYSRCSASIKLGSASICCARVSEPLLRIAISYNELPAVRSQLLHLIGLLTKLCLQEDTISITITACN